MNLKEFPERIIGEFKSIINLSLQLPCDGEKYVFLLCAWKMGSLKSSHKYDFVKIFSKTSQPM